MRLRTAGPIAAGMALFAALAGLPTAVSADTGAPSTAPPGQVFPYRAGPHRVPVAYTPDEVLASRLAGSTLRAEVWDGFLNENHIHRFHPDGTVDGEFTAQRTIRLGIDFVQETDRGRWAVQDGVLCVTWRKFFLGRQQCYGLTPLGRGRVRFANLRGGPSFVARMSATD